MSNETPPPDDWRAKAFLQHYPNAKLDGFEPGASPAPPEPKLPEPPRSGTISSERLAVIVAVSDNVHEFVLDKLQRATILSLIVRMHNGTPHLHAQPIENMNVQVFAPKIHIEDKK